MPAPTALLKQVDDTPSQVPLLEANEDVDFELEGINVLPEDANAVLQPVKRTEESDMEIDEEDKPQFAPAQNTDPTTHIQSRKVSIPPHRFTPLKNTWPKIYPPLVEHLKLQVRMNVKHKRVELRTSKHTTDTGALQKGEDFVRAFALGFDVDDAIALLRLDDLYIETFEVKDVKTLSGDHLARAIGRIAGKDGKTKFAIENASRTRVVLADSKIHILGGFKNIHIARESIVSLILGKPPGKVYNNLRTVSARMKERF
ncbi:eukaryotic type KH-domain (KH-domain type I) [Annulohypoxylon maeteangense]|uniref:eukaryotic type KH-domain (KH-domain type I) n=1 Tax=Annulohypoxylon maeteangense TaxID=1927788 RepID=UPI0020080CAF|nr:eukaryotic type KH-domain (KH-domain type I) [Annulohypoxylon maeteangense]KAI0889726.1 eukaryotic type KH-domain (KH-domain type I) [Annulohypoxylon maeteangense]